MTRWMRGPEVDRPRDRSPFDPVGEGARYRLPPELSIAIWERGRADATDAAGRCDLAQAQQVFHDLAARIAARGGRLHPDVGKLTRVGAGGGGGSYRATPGRQTLVTAEAHGASVPPPAMRSPGRQTLVDAEAHRGLAVRETSAVTMDDTTSAPDLNERPGTAEIARIMAALQSPRPVPAPSDSLARSPEPEPADGSRPGRDRNPRNHALPAVTLDRMERAFGRPFHDVEIHADSAEVPVGQQAFTRGNHIHLERGAVDLDQDREHELQGRSARDEHRDHVLAHELAHVVQQSRGAGAGADRLPTRAALEADAHQAALSALAGRAATVHLFAPPAAALGFSRGEPPDPTQQLRSAAPAVYARAPSSSARGHAPASHSGSAPAPRPTLRTTAFDRPAARSRPAAASSPVAGPAASSRRGGGGDGLLIPEAPSALSPAAVGRLQNIRAANQGVAGAVTNLPTAEHQTSVARDAVVEPRAEQDAHAQHGVVAAVDDRPPPSPEIEAACARIRQVIRDKRPPSEDKLVDAKPREMAQEAGNEMSAGVEQRADTVRQGYADMQQSPQGTPSRTPVPATLPPERVATPPVDAAAGAPDALHDDDVSLDSDVAAQNKRIDDAGMNTEPAKLVKDGPIGEARGGADDLQHMAKTDPHKVLADQAAAVAHAQSDMRALQAAAEAALASARAGTVEHITAHTTGVKGGEEQQRAQAGAQMQAIFTRTQQSVDALLQPLSAKAVARWQAGVDQLSTEFEASLADVKKQIEERHSGFLGFFSGIGDALFGLPSWVTEKYDAAEAKFGDGATHLITEISRDVNQIIEDCKKLIQQARKDIEDIVHRLPASLQTWAQGEAQKLGQKLDQLGQHVDQTQHSLNQDLINRANGAVQQVRERVADLREQARGLLAKIGDAILAFLKNPLKAIIDGLLRILGIPPDQFWSVVSKLGEVIGAILKDPVKFINTLISGTGQGFQRFFDHFPQHLGQGIMSWLFGTLGAVGVQMPTDFSGPGIMAAVLGMMGIDGGLVTSMLASFLTHPEERAEAQEDIASVRSGGPMAIVELLREYFDPASLLSMIKDAVIQFLIEAIIKAAVPRIAMLFNPAGAILEAIEALFRVLLWVIRNAARIFTLIETLMDAAGQMAAGNVAAVAGSVESALAQLIAPVLDFLADYLGLGGLPGKIRDVIMKLRGKIEAALKKALGAISQRAKARAKARRDPHKPAPDKHLPDKHDDHTRPPSGSDPHKPKHDKDKGKDQDHGKDKVGKDKDGKGKLPIGKTISFVAAGDNVDKETHKTWIEVTGNRPRLMVASNTEEVRQQLEHIQKEATTKKQKEAYAAAEAQFWKTESAAQEVLAQKDRGQVHVEREEHLEVQQKLLAEKMKALFSLCLGTIDNWIQYTLEKPVGHVQAEPRVLHNGGRFGEMMLGDHYKNAYIANITAVPPQSPDDLVSPVRIGRAYSNAFNNTNDLWNRFALVIGVNTFEDLKNTAQGKVHDATTAGVGQEYPWGIIGFTWAQTWKNKSTKGDATMNDVRKYFLELPSERQTLMLAYEKHKRAAPPMGEIRDVIHGSDFTKKFYAELSQRAERVFIQVGDGDVVNLNPKPDPEPRYFNRYDQLLERMVEDIGQQARTGSSTQAQAPIIASGGYHLELKASVGQGGAFDARTVLAAKLDLAVRNAMAKVDPGSVYFPEPNLIIQCTPETIAASFGQGALESRNLVKDAIRILAPRRPRLFFRAKGAIVTTTPDRMEVVPVEP